MKGSEGSLSLAVIHLFKGSGCIMRLPEFATFPPSAACQSC